MPCNPISDSRTFHFVRCGGDFRQIFPAVGGYAMVISGPAHKATAVTPGSPSADIIADSINGRFDCCAPSDAFLYLFKTFELVVVSGICQIAEI